MNEQGLTMQDLNELDTICLKANKEQLPFILRRVQDEMLRRT